MTEIKYKPMSVNRAWQGRRFKTKEYQQYENDLLLLMPQMKIPAAPYSVYLEFGMNTLSDLDNPIKLLLDILQKKYKINDRDILEITAVKTPVKKGNEFIKYSINAKTH